MHNSLKVPLIKFFQCFDVPVLAFPCFSALERGKIKSTTEKPRFGLVSNNVLIPDLLDVVPHLNVQNLIDV